MQGCMISVCCGAGSSMEEEESLSRAERWESAIEKWGGVSAQVGWRGCVGGDFVAAAAADASRAALRTEARRRARVGILFFGVEGGRRGFFEGGVVEQRGWGKVLLIEGVGVGDGVGDWDCSRWRFWRGVVGGGVGDERHAF